MKKIIATIIVSATLFACSDNADNGKKELQKDSSVTATAKTDTSKKSIPSETKKLIGNTEIKINYHSPGVRGRTIWGGLVAYDAVWVTGAHKATTIEVGKDFTVGDKTIPAGKYAIFTIPGKEEWTIIINKNWNQHLADDYSEKDDLARFNVKPQTTNEMVERLKYEIDVKGEEVAEIIISWEKVKVAFAIEII